MGAAKRAHVSVMATTYEQQRLEHIRRNQEYMSRLGLAEIASSIAAPKPVPQPKRKRVKAEVDPDAPVRRSSRVRTLPPEFTGASIDQLADGEECSDSDDEAMDRKKSRR